MHQFCRMAAKRDKSMNNIHEKDWAEDSWCGHSGMTSSSDYCFDHDIDDLRNEQTEQPAPDPSEK